MSKALSAAPCGLRRGRHRQKRSPRLRVGTVGLPSLWSTPGTRPPTPTGQGAAAAGDLLRAVATERLSLRAAGRVFGVARQTLAKWLETSSQSLTKNHYPTAVLVGRQRRSSGSFPTVANCRLYNQYSTASPARFQRNDSKSSWMGGSHATRSAARNRATFRAEKTGC